MGSTRLPGKVLTDIGGKPLLSHVIGRLATMRNEAKSVVATSTASENDSIEAWCVSHEVAVFGG